MKRYAVLLLFALFAATVMGEDITTIDGTVYKDIRITETTPIGLNFVCNDKACWVDFRDLPPAVAQKYGYDPAKAAEFEKALAQNQGSAVPGNPAEMVADKAGIERDTVPAATPAPDASVAVNTPVANATVNVALPPPQVIVVNNGDTVIYDQQIVYEPTTTIWVSWCGRYYPRSYWHYWYWKDRYVYCDGRYYPAHSYYRGGVWDHGKYYKYAPDPRRNFPAGNRDSRLSYSARTDNRGAGRNQAVANNDRNSNRSQAAVSDSRGSSQVQTVNNDNHARVQNAAYENRGTAKTRNVANDNRKPATAQVENQASAKVQNVVYENRGAAKAQNVTNDSRKPATAQVENQASAKVQNVVYEKRSSSQTPVVNENRVKFQNVANENRSSSQTPVVNENRVKFQNVANENRNAGQTAPVIASRVQVAANDSPRSVQPVSGDNRISGVPATISDSQVATDKPGGNRGEGRR